MITPDYARLMARYNQWQNISIYEAAASLDDAARKLERGAFFGSIHATLNHILWADRFWLHRFSGTPKPPIKPAREALATYEGFEDLRAQRIACDELILKWAGSLQQADVEGDLTYYATSAGREMKRNRALLIMHMFNHQTHHRGQIHAMLTQAGAKPENTDLPFLRA